MSANGTAKTAIAGRLRTAGKLNVTVARIVGGPTTSRIRALLLGEAILFRTHDADKLYPMDRCYLSIPWVDCCHTHKQ